MQTAQKLYEGINIGKETVGLITYMRTDATQIDPNFITVMRNFINKDFGEKYLATDVESIKPKLKMLKKLMKLFALLTSKKDLTKLNNT